MGRVFSRGIWVLFLGILGRAPCLAGPLSLSQLAEEALTRSPALGPSRHQVRAAQEESLEARRAAWPSLSARALAMRGDDPVYVFGSRLRQQGFEQKDFDLARLNNPTPLTLMQSGLELQWPLYTGHLLESRRGLTDIGVRLFETTLKEKESALRQACVEGYLAWLQADAMVRVLDERIASSGLELARAQKLKERGLILGSDYFAAEALLSQLKAWRVREMSRRASAEKSLMKLRGSWDEPTLVNATLEMDFPPYPALASGVDWRRQPQVVRASLAESSSLLQERVSSARSRPQVGLTASLDSFTKDFGGFSSARTAGVALQWAFADATAQPRERAAEAMKDASVQARLSSEADARELFESAQVNDRAAREALPLLKDGLAEAKSSLELLRPLYREGRQSVLDLLKGEEALALSWQAVWQGVCNVHRAFAALCQASGGLEDADLQLIQDHFSRGAP